LDGLPFPNHQPQPEKERHFRIAQVFLQPGRDFQIGVLNDIGGVEPCLQPLVEAHLDHAAQPLAVAGIDFGQGGLIPRPCPFEKVHGVVGVILHQVPHKLLPARGQIRDRKAEDFSEIVYPESGRSARKTPVGERWAR
jgi:hypothetical protein